MAKENFKNLLLVKWGMLSLLSAYESYKATFCDNGVDGEMVSAMTDDEFNEFADELGVTSKLHKRF